jgi:hypothetical protein
VACRNPLIFVPIGSESSRADDGHRAARSLHSTRKSTRHRTPDPIPRRDRSRIDGLAELPRTCAKKSPQCGLCAFAVRFVFVRPADRETSEISRSPNRPFIHRGIRHEHRALRRLRSVHFRQRNPRGIQEGTDPEKSRRQTRAGKIIADRRLFHEGPLKRSIRMNLFDQEIIV